MTALAWFDDLKAKGLVDFKCAISSTKSSFSAICEELRLAQTMIDAGLGKDPNRELRPDRPEIAAVRAKLVQRES